MAHIRLAVVGCPNVGKSVLFGQLTGRYASVSNYPGTTVEVTRGLGRWSGHTFEVVDTPGLYSLSCVTDEERVARRLLLTERPDLVLQVVDAKNLPRMLPLTLQLLEAGFHPLLVVNMLDEARAAGLEIDLPGLERRLGIPVVGTALIRGEGVAELRDRLANTADTPRRPAPAPAQPEYGPDLARIITLLVDGLKGNYGLSRLAVASLCLQEDPELVELVRRREGTGWARIAPLIEAANQGAEPARLVIPLTVHRLARAIAAACVRQAAPPRRTAGMILGDLLLHPALGLPVLASVIYFGLYRFVGGFGAGTLVDVFDRLLFLDRFNPWADRMVDALIADPLWRDLLVHEYGLLTLGLRYAVAIVLPIVGTFFVCFAVLEDSGYLPRLALLTDRMLKTVGLSGRALIPLALGLGCGTMATLVTRTLETRRERVLATFILALGVPCSAQLGVVMGVLAGRPYALGVWSLSVVCVLIAGGMLVGALLPGRAAPFFTEVPPLRVPHPLNVWHKTTARMVWYFREILPIFLGASIVIWVGRWSGLFPRVLAALGEAAAWLGLPRETAVVFLFGFLRRDYGAAGLHDLAPSLPTSSLIVVAVTLTLFVPCLAQTVLMFKERGPLTATAVLVTVFPLAIAAGYGLSRILAWLTGGGW